MKRFAVALVFLAAGLCRAQQWEFGAVGGASFLNNVPVSGSAGSASAGFSKTVAVGGYLGQSISPRLSGELWYLFEPGSLRLNSNGTTATFAGQEHSIHYDLVVHFQKSESRREYFAVVGGGMRLFRGTGQPQAYQPLNQVGYLTNTQSVKPLFTFGGGVRYTLRPRVVLRAEVRDFISPFPTTVIAPAPGNSFGGVLNDIVPMVGITYLF